MTDALSALGMTSLTAYFGILEVGQVKEGDFVVVSGAAGATGSVACQVAKILGARVLGLAGSGEKVQWCKLLLHLTFPLGNNPGSFTSLFASRLEDTNEK